MDLVRDHAVQPSIDNLSELVGKTLFYSFKAPHRDEFDKLTRIFDEIVVPAASRADRSATDIRCLHEGFVQAYTRDYQSLVASNLSSPLDVSKEQFGRRILTVIEKLEEAMASSLPSTPAVLPPPALTR